MSAAHDESIGEWELRRRRLVTSGIKNAAAMLRAAKDKPDFLIDERIPAGALTFVVAPPGGTKSWLVYDLAVKVARQGERRWLDKNTSEAPMPVLVLSYDNPTAEVSRRFKRLGMRDEDPIYFHSVDQEPWKVPSAADNLRDVVIELAPKLVIFDAFRQGIEGNENDSEAMGKVMGCFKAMAACESKPAVIVIHHAAKGMVLEGSGARGSGEIEGSADAVIAIERGAVRFTKTRSWPMSETWKLKYTLTDSGATTRLDYEKATGS